MRDFIYWFLNEYLRNEGTSATAYFSNYKLYMLDDLSDLDAVRAVTYDDFRTWLENWLGITWSELERNRRHSEGTFFCLPELQLLKLSSTDSDSLRLEATSSSARKETGTPGEPLEESMELPNRRLLPMLGTLS